MARRNRDRHRPFARKAVAMPSRVRHILLDAENLFGAPDLGVLDMRDLRLGGVEILEDVGYGAGDILYIAVSHRNAKHAAVAFPGLRQHWRSGEDGADLELSAIADGNLGRTDRIAELVVGSGDGHFVDTVRKYTSIDIPVTVVANPRGLSTPLRRAATSVFEMRPDFGAWRLRA